MRRTSSSSGDAPLLIYDAECAFCRRAVARWRARTGERVRYVPLQNARLLRRLGIPKARAERSLQLIEPSGRTYEGARAVFAALRRAPGLRLLSLVGRLPVVRTLAEWIYRRIARHRTLAERVDRWLFGDSLSAPTTRLIRWLFSKALGGVYLIAFTSLRGQVLGLYGSRGILPIRDFLERLRAVTGRERYRQLPTLLWLDASDQALLRLCDYGQLSSLALMLGIAPRLAATLSWALYLSFVSVGRDFLSFQWDALLLETGLDGIVVAPGGLRPRIGADDTPAAAVALMRWLVFRLHFESGVCKLQSRDPTWRDGTACTYHYETQPLPTPLSWYAHHLPRRFQQLSTLLVLAVESAVPFLAFFPRRPRRAAFVVLVGLQLLIAATGNYGFFNVLTAALDLWLLDDDSLRRRRRARALPPPRRPRLWARLLSWAASAPIIATSLSILLARLRLVRRLPRAVEELHDRIAPLHSLNSYGLFAVMTTSRPEIVVEGSDDGVTWREYTFRYKPGDPRRPPRFVAPHQPRLDWQMWFAALGPPPAWFRNFLARLLEGSPEVLRLLAANPFGERPPLLVRALLYDYKLSDRAARKRGGGWWQRELLGLYYPPCCLPRRRDEVRSIPAS
jgi:predicted DCC family thiol-disulfide oxidoreductase YuxK